MRHEIQSRIAAMAKDVTQFRHPNDLVTLAIAELGSISEPSIT